MPALFIGGAEKQYRYIISSLSKKNRELTVLLLNKPIKGQEQATRDFINEHGSVKFYQLNGNVLNCGSKNKFILIIRKIKTLFKQRRWLKKHLKKNHYDVVMYSYVTQLLMTELFYKQGTKVIFNERNTGRQICDKDYKIKLLKKCYKVIANSSYAANYISEKTGIDVTVVNNGIVFSAIQCSEHEEFNIIIPARINRIKNQMIVLKALTLLNINQARVKFAGAVDDIQYGEELKKFVSDYNLKDNVEFLGFVDNMQKLYREADLVILPSFEEGTPNVLLEAYMYGIVPLVSNIAMNASCCLFDELLFNPNDENDLAKKIELAYIGSLVKERDAVLEANFKFLHDNYSIEEMAKNYDLLIFGN